MLCFDLGSLLDGSEGAYPEREAPPAPPVQEVLAAIPEALNAYRVVILPGRRTSDRDLDQLRRRVRSHLCDRYGLQRGYLMFTLLRFSTRRRLSPSARRAYRVGPTEAQGAVLA